MPLQLHRIKISEAAAIASNCELEEAARAALDPSDTPGAYLEKLVAASAFHDAIRFLATALPPREAIGWACLCLRRTAPPAPESPEKAILDATEGWVRSPGDETRRAAFQAATERGSGSPAALLALAAFFSGGSIAPAGMEAVPPPERVSASMIAGGIFLTAIPGDPVQIPQRLQACLNLGIDIAKGQPG
jgi:hypothetical protein